ncbi:MAG TPA: PKD domain-containing protein, partial [Candidatus Anammoximicrobium sp.]|nr:PKD domain-containing protein [Candidatus Anammoximicrobium sp.]
NSQLAVNTLRDHLYVGTSSEIQILDSALNSVGSYTLPDGYTPARLVTAAGSSRLYAIGTKTGVTNWRVFVLSAGNTPPLAADDTYAVDEDTPLSVAAVSWTELSPMPTARGSAMAGVIGDRLYVMGGNAGGTGASDVLEAYDPATGTWTARTAAPQRKYGGTASVIAGKLYVAGGWNWPLSGIPTSTLQIYDAASNTWSLGADMPILSGCSASGTVDGKLYVLTACDGWGGYKNHLHAYDPASNTWTAKAGSPHSHSNAAAGVIGGKLYVAGGWDDSGPNAYLDAYDPVTNSWSTLASLPVAVGGSGGAVLDGKLYVMGGSDGSDVSTVYVYDPAANVWNTDSPMNVARSALVAGAIGEVIYTAGGTGPLATLEGLLATGVLANDSDAHGGAPAENNLPLTAELVAGPAHAAAFALHGDGSFDYTPSQDYNGQDWFTYRAVDSLGGVSAPATVTLTVRSVNDPPLAEAGADQLATEGSTVAFDGSGSSDPDGDLLSYYWAFGDGGIAEGLTPTHVYADNGTYTVTLTVEDAVGVQAIDTLTVTVTNVAPGLGALAATTPVDEGAIAHLTGSLTDPGTADTFSIVIDWGDSSPEELLDLPAGTTDFAQTHIYADNATYTVTVTVRDDDCDGETAWTQLSPTGSLPADIVAQGLWEHVAAYDPETRRMIVFGGHLDNSLTESNRVLVLDHADGLSGTPAWREIAAQPDPTYGLPAPRTHHDVIYDPGSNRLVVFGGNTNRGYCDGASDTSLWILMHADGTTGTPQWVKIMPEGSIPAARHHHTLDYDPLTNRMLLYGGSVACPSAPSQYFGDLWVLEHANGLGGTPTWTQLAAATAPAGRMAHGAFYDAGENRLMVYGGTYYGGGGDEFWIVQNANGLDRATGEPATPVWTQVFPLNDPAYPSEGKPSWNDNEIAVIEPVYDAETNRMYLFDGHAGTVGDIDDDLWMLEHANGVDGTPQWRRLSSTGADPGSRRYHSVAYDDRLDRMTIFAGWRNESTSPTDVWVLDLAPLASDTETFTVTVENVPPEFVEGPLVEGSLRPSPGDLNGDDVIVSPTYDFVKEGLETLSQHHEAAWGSAWCGPTAAGTSLGWFAEYGGYPGLIPDSNGNGQVDEEEKYANRNFCG